MKKNISMNMNIKNILYNEYIMVLFILFPARGNDKNYWNYTSTGSKCHFVDKLKKLGKVYIYTPCAYNLNSNNFEKLHVTLEKLNLDYHVECIYNKIKHITEPFIPIGHSIGAFYAMKFAEKYENLCKAVILLDPSNMRGVFDVLKKDPEYNEISKYDNIKISNLVEEIKRDFRLDIDSYQLNLKIKILLRIITFNIQKQSKSLTLKLNIPLIIFINIDDITPNDTKEVADAFDFSLIRKSFFNLLIKNNMDNIYMYHLVNATHFIHWTSTNYVIDIIKKFA